MKISSVKVYLIKSGLLHPVIVRIDTDEGIYGVGEAAIAYGLGGTAAAGMVKDLANRILIGRDPHAIEAIWSEMYDHSFWAKGGGPIVFAGISAIEQALWDIKGKALNVPVYQLLGGKVRDAIRVYANGWSTEATTAADFARAAERPLKDGYTALKFYPLAMPDSKGTICHPTHRALDREQVRLAFDRVRAVCDLAGPDIDIMLDLSGALTTDETIRLCQRYEDLGIEFIEEPADPFDLGALKKISEKVNIPIAVGERLYTRYGFRKLMEMHVADTVQPDVGNTGGIMETKKIAAMAEAYNLRVAPHNCASPVCTAATLHIAANVPNFSILEMYPYSNRHSGYLEFTDVIPEHEVKNGYLKVPDKPGIGIELIEEKIDTYLWAEIKT
ncbi:mandelate racemase/muconate lactonizing enzyme family protein [Polaromonas sp. JS666]|uniref:mandelate racemase/muconate lactonizing enzyme family protein n=1 Tax=Polaromonas sp. (strain JS666 / ATCC BAA-500) TaxID=296591 RepID=UPI0000464876|nr:mandelate racemase/muconate lactonizing enzyme family protein [Polaromonas sp. JS666]ABE46247.1 mandelate racemase/muconate lactonizing enzyme [Polaromonas sp. JS666]